MKIYLGLITAAALALTACSPEAPKPAETTPPATETPPASSAETAPPAETTPEASTPAANNAQGGDVAEGCATEITSDDAMKYDPTTIDVKSSCKQFKITLKHVGKMPKAAMGHNVVVTSAADKEGVLKDGAEAGLDKDYVKPDDARVIAHTKLIGGGEEDSVVLDVSKLAKDGTYEYFCSFPGHSAQMNGKINLVD